MGSTRERPKSAVALERIARPPRNEQSIESEGVFDRQAVKALIEAGVSYYQHGQCEAAKRLLEKALVATAALSGESDGDLLPILNQLDHVYLQLGELKKAWKCSERSLRITEAIFGSQSTRLAVPLASLTNVYFALGLLDKCYRAAERALTILQAVLGDDHIEVAMARDRLGLVLAEMGAYERARTLHLGALATLRERGDRSAIAAILANVAGTYLAAGDLAAARPFYEEALATARAAFGDAHESTGTYSMLLGDYKAEVGQHAGALRAYRRALAMKRKVLGELHPDVAALLFRIGRLVFRRNRAVGRQIVLQAIAILDMRVHRPQLFADICSFLARILSPSSAAILFWKLAINDIEILRKHIARLNSVLERSFLRQNRDDFRALGDSLISLGRLPEAQQVLTMLKEHELFKLTTIDARRTKIALTTLEAKWAQRGREYLNRLRLSLEDEKDCRQIADAANASALRSRIVEAGKHLSARLDDLVADFAAVEDRPKRRQQRAPGVANAPGSVSRPEPGVALLQYLLSPDHRNLSIILTTADLQCERRIGLAEAEVQKLVYAMREAVQNRSAPFLPSAQRLYAMLIAPVIEVLQTAHVNTLACSLDSVLRYLPMGALHDGSHYLIEQFALLLSSPVAATRAPSNYRRRAVGLGVSRPVDGHQPLFGVREELTAVIRTAHRRRGVLPGIIRLDRAFTAGALVRALSSKYSVIHVASHFVFEATREPSSYLLLGDGSKLTLAELGDLRFDAMDLVVLSACNTAVGAGRGHEIEGLGALVRHQGAHQVLATLWPVVDLTTAALMRAFYRNRYTADLSPPESLRRAQLRLLRGAMKSSAKVRTRCLVDPDEDRGEASPPADTRHPFYWAPYILIGSPPHAQ